MLPPGEVPSGRPEKHCRRAICDAIFYLVDNGVKWRALPADFPPRPTVYAFFARWAREGVDRELMAFPRREVPTRAGRRAEPSAGVVDAMGLLPCVLVTAAAVQDRDGGTAVLTLARHVASTLRHVWADGA